ncbi:hypothetical protein AcW1_009326 [Taiwanofungus camphoratus]|nr:hypothetical protein AcV5_003401 [Antrodia cinnamomea]KAI0935088.1 hypothetical protein AcV7_003990 [Antrodia cinnamomea]KAI0947613.1 hypothetical protein AcW1_009326 [Antrodia cinnamomea]
MGANELTQSAAKDAILLLIPFAVRLVPHILFLPQRECVQEFTRGVKRPKFLPERYMRLYCIVSGWWLLNEPFLAFTLRSSFICGLLRRAVCRRRALAMMIPIQYCAVLSLIPLWVCIESTSSWTPRPATNSWFSISFVTSA